MSHRVRVLSLSFSDLVRDPGEEVLCGGCKERAHDAFGCHPSVCKAGNRGGLWTTMRNTMNSTMISRSSAISTSNTKTNPERSVNSEDHDEDGGR